MIKACTIPMAHSYLSASLNNTFPSFFEREVNICFEFDNFVREVFEIEPPLGEQICRIGQIVLLIIISCWITNVGFFILLLLNRTSTWFRNLLY